MVSGILTGCTDQVNSEQVNNINELKQQIKELTAENEALQNSVMEQREILEEMNAVNPIILAKDIETYPQSLYKKEILDIDGDGVDELIELYVNAQKMENGTFAWDDGQAWLLVVKDGEQTYPLFADYVQLGSIDFSTTNFDGKMGIVMLKTWHSNKTVQKFTYDQVAQGFVKETIYNQENILEIDNQPASSAFFKDAYELLKLAFEEKAIPVLEASEIDLQESQKRMEIIYPISDDLRNANRLFEIAGELNPQLYVNLNLLLEWINQMEIDQPTSVHMNQLRYIHNLFSEKKVSNLIIEEKNQIHPEIKEQINRIDVILHGKK